MAGASEGNVLSEAIVTVRKRQAMTQKQVESATGIPQVTVSRWENGAEPSLDDLARLEDGLGVARGTILREAGYVAAEPRTVGEVIDSDPTLSERVRPLVWATYRQAQALSAELDRAGEKSPARARRGSPLRL